jgi:hypothetical protein
MFFVLFVVKTKGSHRGISHHEGHEEHEGSVLITTKDDHYEI